MDTEVRIEYTNNHNITSSIIWRPPQNSFSIGSDARDDLYLHRAQFHHQLILKRGPSGISARLFGGASVETSRTREASQLVLAKRKDHDVINGDSYALSSTCVIKVNFISVILDVPSAPNTTTTLTATSPTVISKTPASLPGGPIIPKTPLKAPTQAPPATPGTPMVYPPSFFTSGQPLKFPSDIEPSYVLSDATFIPQDGESSAVLFICNAVTKDAVREREEQDQLMFSWKAQGVKWVWFVRNSSIQHVQDMVQLKTKQGMKVDNFYIVAASHGSKNFAGRLFISMHSGGPLDSYMLTRWGFDIGKRVFITALTCDAENLAKDVPWPSGAVGGLVYASSHNRTATLRYFDAADPQGNVTSVLYDTFARSLFEVLFCIYGIVEFEYNISFSGFWRRIQAAHSIATGGSASMGFQGYFNGREIPLRLLSWDNRQKLLKSGFLAEEGVYNESGKLVCIQRYVKPRAFEYRTSITDIIERQIALRQPDAPFLVPTASSSTVAVRRDSGIEKEVDVEFTQESSADLAAESAQPSLTDSSTMEESILQAEAKPEANLESPSKLVTESSKVKEFNSAHGSTTKPKKCKDCGKTLVSFSSYYKYTQHLAQFTALNLTTYALTRNAKSASCGKH